MLTVIRSRAEKLEKHFKGKGPLVTTHTLQPFELREQLKWLAVVVTGS